MFLTHIGVLMVVLNAFRSILALSLADPRQSLFSSYDLLLRNMTSSVLVSEFKGNIIGSLIVTDVREPRTAT